MGSRFCLQMPLSKPKERTETNRCESTRMSYRKESRRIKQGVWGTERRKEQ